jgi:ATF/CREB family transcription factor
MSFHRRLANNSLDPPPTVKEPPDQSDNKTTIKNASNAATTHDLLPPPRPIPQNTEESAVDYFSAGHTTSHFPREPNPFDQAFANPSSELPVNKSLLPPVAALTSPAPLGGDGPSTGGYNWAGSLRSGPLSPAMLGGPVGAGPGDYFDPSLRGSFPSGVTPNESSLRTGLTPGGGGSMFPAPSPNSQALYQQLAVGGATPNTLDFHRTAMSAAQRKGANGTNHHDDKRAPVAPMDSTLQQQPQQPSFGQHDNDAANGLFLLAQAGNGAQANNQFATPNTTNANMPNNRSHETSPNMGKGARNTGSIGGQSEMSGDISDSGDQGKPATRSRGKRSSAGKSASTNGKRKQEETPSKQSSSKKSKINNMGTDMDGMDSDEEQPNIKEEQYHADGKKMTDEEKRKNFLERNRYAATNWLSNVLYLIYVKGGSIKMPAAEKAMACQPTSQSRNI